VIAQGAFDAPPERGGRCTESALFHGRSAMTEPTIVCPSCKREIKLTESLAAPLIESTRRQYEQRIAEKDAEVAKREASLRQQQEAIRKQEAAVAKARESLDEQVAARVKDARAAIAEEEAKKARIALGSDLEQRTRELAELNAVLKQRDEKLAEAQQAQADLLRKQRELDDARRELDLTVEKRVQTSLSDVRQQARREASDEFKLKVAEGEQTIAAMARQIEELKRKAEQGSQQLQGEVQELELEAMLRAKFPRDAIEPVPKGEHGGDALHRVFGPAGQPCGTILWESKRTRNWSDAWLPKLREDMRAAGAEIAVIVTQALPKGTDTFDLVDGVWVTSFACAVPVGVALRQTMIELSAARAAGEGQQTKMELVYQYLTGPRFKHRVDAIVERFKDMQEDLEKERRTMTRLWAKRDEQIRGVVDATAGMYGDLQGIAGKSMPEIDGLGMKMLESDGGRPNGASPGT